MPGSPRIGEVTTYREYLSLDIVTLSNLEKNAGEALPFYDIYFSQDVCFCISYWHSFLLLMYITARISSVRLWVGIRHPCRPYHLPIHLALPLVSVFLVILFSSSFSHPHSFPMVKLSLVGQGGISTPGWHLLHSHTH